MGPLQHTMEYMSWYISNSSLYLSVPQMLNDPRMHRALTSTNVPPTKPYATRHDLIKLHLYSEVWREQGILFLHT